MSNPLANWLDHRTGYRKIAETLLIERIPGGARWRYVWGSCLATVFLIQLVTGLLLVTAYSPGASTAWSSVFFIQYHMDFGWLIRGLHHFGSQAMVVLMALHVLQVVIAGAHLPPREINWWLGLALLGAVLGLSLTGYLLPWDQKGFWATQVATNIAANLPVVGPWLQRIIVGGPEYGHHTLTRFYALHVVVLPPLVMGLIALHIFVFRRHGVTAPKNAVGEGWFWPDQAFRDMLVGLVILAVLVAVVLWGHGHAVDGPAIPGEQGAWESIAHAGRAGLGANLDAPADPGQAYPARPEWYFLFLFQLLKYFEGDQEIIGTVYIPAGAGALLFLLPLLGYGRMRKFGHGVGILVIVGLLGGAIGLTGQALIDDANNETLKKEFVRAQALAKRAIQLADGGIPPAGPLVLLRRDPMTRGRELFGRHCATCHNYGTQFTKGNKAADLEGYGTEEWIMGLLTDPVDPKYFGHTELTRMGSWAEKNLVDLEPEEQADLQRIAGWLARHPRASSPDADSEAFQAGLEAFEEAFGRRGCIDCHGYEGKGGRQRGPDFTGYGGANWIRAMIVSPDHKLRYGKDNAMPVFLDLEGPDAEIIQQENAERESQLMHLADVERELIIRWLTNDPRPVFGGDPITSPPSR